jgi:hypothetical protein
MDLNSGAIASRRLYLLRLPWPTFPQWLFRIIGRLVNLEE